MPSPKWRKYWNGDYVRYTLSDNKWMMSANQKRTITFSLHHKLCARNLILSTLFDIKNCFFWVPYTRYQAVPPRRSNHFIKQSVEEINQARKQAGYWRENYECLNKWWPGIMTKGYSKPAVSRWSRRIQYIFYGKLILLPQFWIHTSFLAGLTFHKNKAKVITHLENWNSLLNPFNQSNHDRRSSQYRHRCK